MIIRALIRRMCSSHSLGGLKPKQVCSNIKTAWEVLELSLTSEKDDLLIPSAAKSTSLAC